MAFYSRKHYERVGGGRPDTAADVADRKRRNDILDQVKRERDERFPVLSADNVDAALKFQEDRFNELYRGGGR